ncbi:MAG: hypothetical protein GPOALKHO_001000 [Sodalis sp.]|nr:MAG: hypothetical protein GPOALKHO_001000 [Sodalis sp.]
MIQAILSTLRSQHYDNIINIGSIEGPTDFDFLPFTACPSLRWGGVRCQSGARLCPVMYLRHRRQAWLFRTDFLDASSVRYSDNPIADYDDVTNGSVVSGIQP